MTNNLTEQLKSYQVLMQTYSTKTVNDPDFSELCLAMSTYYEQLYDAINQSLPVNLLYKGTVVGTIRSLKPNNPLDSLLSFDRLLFDDQEDSTDYRLGIRLNQIDEIGRVRPG